MRTLVCGWFSFEDMGASAGDLIARDLVCEWLADLGQDFDTALATPFVGGIDWKTADPAAYTHVLFVCGPLGNGPPVDALLRRFQDTRLIGVNLTMLDDLENWNPFELLIERDSSRASNPDICFAAEPRLVPVVALTLIDSQPEYGERNRLADAHRLVYEMLDNVDAALMHVNTRLDLSQPDLRSAAAIESLISKADVVISTRLHGMVLGLKTGVPVLAIDSVSGGDKITRQAAAIGWPICLTIDGLGVDELQAAFQRCLTDEMRREAGQVAARAGAFAGNLRHDLAAAYQETDAADRRRA